MLFHFGSPVKISFQGMGEMFVRITYELSIFKSFVTLIVVEKPLQTKETMR